MVLSLFGVTLICSASVALVQGVTLEPIAQAQLAATKVALADVLPEFDDSKMRTKDVGGRMIDVYTAKQGGDVIGYAVKSMTNLGYSGEIVVMVGIAPDGELLNAKVLKHSETPGLGSELTDPNNAVLSSIKGRLVSSDDQLSVKKDGGDVDALSGATISSRAFLDAIMRAYDAVEKELSRDQKKRGGDNE